jgi:hypothetical protein
MFEPRDLWVGVYWTKHIIVMVQLPNGTQLNFDPPLRSLQIYVCLIPMLPILIEVPLKGVA